MDPLIKSQLLYQLSYTPAPPEKGLARIMTAKGPQGPKPVPLPPHLTPVHPPTIGHAANSDDAPVLCTTACGRRGSTRYLCSPAPIDTRPQSRAKPQG